MNDISYNANDDHFNPINSVVSLSLFPSTALPCNFHSITGIDVTYHPHLYNNHNKWMEAILPIIRLLVSSFHVQHIFILCHRDPAKPCLLEKTFSLFHSSISTWFISNHSVFSHNLGDNISCSRSIFYLQPLQLLSSIVFAPTSFSSYPNSVSWLSPTFNTLHFDHFATTNIVNLSPSDSTDVPFYHSRLKGFVQVNPDTIPSLSNSIINLLHPVPELHYNIYCDIFDGWFGIPFKDTNCFTYVRSPHLTEILSLYGLPPHHSANQIRTLVLHTLPATVFNHITTTFLSDVVPPTIPPPSSI